MIYMLCWETQKRSSQARAWGQQRGGELADNAAGEHWPSPADLGEQRRRQAVREGMPHLTGGEREITLYLYVRGGGQ